MAYRIDKYSTDLNSSRKVCIIDWTIVIMYFSGVQAVITIEIITTYYYISLFLLEIIVTRKKKYIYLF